MRRDYYLWLGVAVAAITIGLIYSPLQIDVISLYGFIILFAAGCLSAYGIAKKTWNPWVALVVGCLVFLICAHFKIAQAISATAGGTTSYLPVGGSYTYSPTPMEIILRAGALLADFFLPISVYLVYKNLSRALSLPVQIIFCLLCFAPFVMIPVLLSSQQNYLNGSFLYDLYEVVISGAFAFLGVLILVSLLISGVKALVKNRRSA
jgi:hypothetical protein